MDKRLKTIIGVCSLILMTHLPAKASEVFYSPDLCAPEELNLVLINNSDQPLKAWTQVRSKMDIDEIQFDIPAQTKSKISGDEFLKSRQAFTVKTNDNDKLQVILQCAHRPELSLGTFTSPEVTHLFSKPTQSLKIHLLNLFLKSNSVKMKALGSLGEVIEERSITLENYYDTESLKWILPRPVSRLEISGTDRLHSEVLYESQDVELQSKGSALKNVTFNVNPEKTYFLVSTKNQNPSGAFVIALDEAQKIATAREQIADPELEKIVVATVSLGSGNFNRAFASPDKSPYSWSVSQVDAFADFAHIDCDGSPDLVEERLERKLLEGGRICFWRYRVVRELSPLEVSTGLLLKP
ncbi:BP74-related protein [Bdellovibrio svalbardensis]|uniref:BP74 N-terminal domain-containing protein n=1 Tax=Bdellovibrio svalbardensis TaxID=2972972 RepID=A0ABT6DMV5_9BACT|nr:hypothetical protein [Bdellovibrio svalbardensis]MDG0818198.1 hypothetical protein [Bdellovibrio svalbardensis]